MCLSWLIKRRTGTAIKRGGVDRYNHNLNTSERHHSYITTSHTYEDRVNTVEIAKKSMEFRLAQEQSLE